MSAGGDVISVKPRYTDPDAIGHVDDQFTARPSAITADNPISRGILTSLYDNKLIVLFIIVIILVIGFLAYVVWRRPEEEPPKKKKQPVVTPQVAEVPPVVPPSAVTPPVTGGTDQNDPKSMNKTEMLKLLARTRAPVPTSTKNDDEIMQLMEDIDDTPDDEEEPSENDDVADMIDDICSVILRNGNRCKNKSKENGKCHTHRNA